MTDCFLTTLEVARLRHRTVWTVRRWIKEDLLHPVKVRGQYLIPLSQLNRLPEDRLPDPQILGLHLR